MIRGQRPHHHRHHHEPEGQPPPPGRRHFGHGGGPRGHFEEEDFFPREEGPGRGPRGPRGRARRGEARFILLDILRDTPKHGYEIIKALEERSAGAYAASPG